MPYLKLMPLHHSITEGEYSYASSQKHSFIISWFIPIISCSIFARNTYIPASGYAPAVLLDHQGDPISLRKKEKPIVVLSGWGTPEGFQ